VKALDDQSVVNLPPSACSCRRSCRVRVEVEARTFLKRLQQSLGVTTVFVTHDQAEALAMADRMAVMDSGRIRQVGTPREVFQRPANAFVANFIGATPMNLLDAVKSSAGLDFDGFTLPVPRGFDVRDGDKVTYGVRPEYLRVSRSDGAIRASVATVENLGVSVLLRVEAGSQSIGALVPEADEPKLGATVWLTPAPGRELLYRADDGELVE
jgi:multiple sugar transport system ATP-binding protein